MFFRIIFGLIKYECFFSPCEVVEIVKKNVLVEKYHRWKPTLEVRTITSTTKNVYVHIL